MMRNKNESSEQRFGYAKKSKNQITQNDNVEPYPGFHASISI